MTKRCDAVLLQFKCANFLSIAEEQTLSMIPLKGAGNVHDVGNRYAPMALKAIGIYGANGAGKSNLIGAMSFMQFLVKNSGKFDSENPIDVIPFALDDELQRSPSRFEIIFSRFGDIWRYGFSVDTEKVHSEWLFKRPEETAREREMFFRSDTEFRLHRSIRSFSKILSENTNNNQLFLSKLDQFRDKETRNAYFWITISLRPINSISEFPKTVTIEKITNPKKVKDRNSVFAILHSMGIDFEDVAVREFEAPDKYETLEPYIAAESALLGASAGGSRKLYEVNFLRRSRQGSPTSIPFQNESLGTHTLFGVAGMLVDSLKVGFTLVIDELNQTFHPAVLRAIVELFYSDEANHLSGQLIFTSHDTSVMSVLERDQIWIVEKAPDGASTLFSIADFGLTRDGGARRTGAFSKQYLENRFGGLPRTGLVEAISALVESNEDFD